MLLDGGCVGGRLGGPSNSVPDRPVKVNSSLEMPKNVSEMPINMLLFHSEPKQDNVSLLNNCVYKLITVC